jgi:serine/threonine-protein kinase RsbT
VKDVRVLIHEECDVGVVRRRARELARQRAFRAASVEAIATAVTEIARNIVVHAGAGEVLLSLVEERGRAGLVVVARDEAHGIADVELAMRDGYSTAGGLGLGLPSARRLMDEFAMVSAPGRGTTVTMKKWVHEREQ